MGLVGRATRRVLSSQRLKAVEWLHDVFFSLLIVDWHLGSRDEKPLHLYASLLSEQWPQYTSYASRDHPGVCSGCTSRDFNAVGIAKNGQVGCTQMLGALARFLDHQGKLPKKA